MVEKEFVDSETTLTAHIYDENPNCGAKNQSCGKYIWYDLSKLVQEG